MLKGIVFDIDGTLIRGNQALPGAAQALLELKRRGLLTVCLTNDSQETPEAWAKRLISLGFAIAPNGVITAGSLAAEIAANRFSQGTIFPVGDTALKNALEQKGLTLLGDDDSQQADAVVMGMDPSFNQHKLKLVCRHIWNGAPWIATNIDRRRPTENGYVPGTGPMVKAVAWATQTEPLVVGKPSEIAANAALQRLGVSADQALMVGDQPEADIAMGKAARMHTALMLGDKQKPGDLALLPQNQRPDVALDNLMDLLVWLDRGQR